MGGSAWYQSAAPLQARVGAGGQPGGGPEQCARSVACAIAASCCRGLQFLQSLLGDLSSTHRSLMPLTSPLGGISLRFGRQTLPGGVGSCLAVPLRDRRAPVLRDQGPNSVLGSYIL